MDPDQIVEFIVCGACIVDAYIEPPQTLPLLVWQPARLFDSNSTDFQKIAIETLKYGLSVRQGLLAGLRNLPLACALRCPSMLARLQIGSWVYPGLGRVVCVPRIAQCIPIGINALDHDPLSGLFTGHVPAPVPATSR